MLTKKSQITIFIIIGILVLIAIGTFIYFRASVTKAKLEPEIVVTREIPKELNPVKLYVESYIKELTKNAIKTVSMHGGYIEYEKLKTNNIEPTEGNAIEFIRDSGNKIPYWHYLKSKNQCKDDCEFASEMPPLCKPEPNRNCITKGQNSIEEQIERHLKSQLEILDLNLQGFKIEKSKEPQVNVAIRERDVVIYVRYPLRIKTLDADYKLEEFQVITPTSLSEFYELAKKITDYNTKNCFIGRYVNDVHMPNFYWTGSKSQNLLPPRSELKVGDFKIKIWDTLQVKEELKDHISTAVENIGIRNTANFRYPDIDCNDKKNTLICGYMYQQILEPLGDKLYNDNVILTYNPKLHGIYFDIRPRTGNILRPGEISSPVDFALGPSLKIYEYKFFYDYSFPVIVDIRKPNSESQEIFMFALESNIRANKCYNAPVDLPIVDSISLDIDLTCEPTFAKNKLKLTVVDNVNNKPIENADVSYFAGIGICPSTLTDSNGYAEITYPEVPDPLSGVVFSIKKQGYLEKSFTIADLKADFKNSNLITGFATSDLNGEEHSGIVGITPIIQQDVEFRLLPIDLLQSYPKTQDSALIKNSYEKVSDDYSIVLVFTRPSSAGEEEYTTSVYYNDGRLLPEKLQLAPGKYNINAQLMYNKNVILPAEHNMICAESGEPEAIASAIGGTSLALGGCAVAGLLTFGIGGLVCTIVAGEIGSKISGAIAGAVTKCEKKPNCPSNNENCCLYPGPTQEEFERGTCYIKGYTCEGSCKVKEPIDTKETPLGDKVPLGGVILEDIEITPANLEKAKAIFYIIKQNLPSRLHHLKDMNKYEEISKSARNALLPEFE